MQQTGELFSINPSTHLFIVFSTIVSSSAVDHTRFSRPSDRQKEEKGVRTRIQAFPSAFFAFYTNTVC
jgi:hypothetical protein